MEIMDRVSNNPYQIEISFVIIDLKYIPDLDGSTTVLVVLDPSSLRHRLPRRSCHHFRRKWNELLLI